MVVVVVVFKTFILLLSCISILLVQVFDMTQSFVRQVLHSCDPKEVPPLLIHVDDYLGNEQRKIWETTELSQGVQVLASYYGFSSVSYADLVREIVYGDTAEKWFSSDWWETGKF